MLRIPLLIILSLIASVSSAQITGKIVDDSNGEPLRGASLVIDDGEVIISNEDGTFELPSSAAEVTITHVGYGSQNVKLDDDQESLVIALGASSFNLQEVVVSAYHKNRKLVDTPGPIALISKKDLDRDQDLIFTNSVNRVPGVYMHSGALNTNRITIRGIGSRSSFSTNRVKGYLNDIPLTTGDGETTLEDIDLSLIDRMEIVKGPSSTEYGAALGGVINLKVQRPTFAEDNITSNTQIGSFGLIRNSTSFDLGLRNGALKFLGTKTVSDGYRQNNDYDRETGSITGVFDLSDRSTMSFIFNFIDLKAFIPSSIDSTTFAETPRAAAGNWLAARGFEDYERGFLGASFQHRVSDRFSVAYSVFTNFRNADEVRPFDILRENSNAYGVRFKYQYDLGPSRFLPILTMGTEMFSDKLIASTFNNDSIPDLPGAIESDDDVDRNYQNYFLQADWQLSDRLALIAGVNLNRTKYEFEDLFKVDGDQSGEITYDVIASPKIGINYRINPKSSLHATISHGFGPPTFEETRESDGAINPGIGPETGYNYEIGSRGSLLNDRLFYDVSVFTMRIRDLLVSRRIAEDQLLGINAGKTTHNGVEMALGYRLYENQNGFITTIDGHVNYTHADYEFDSFIDGDNDFSGNRLTGNPRNTLNGIVEFETSVGIYGNLNYRFVDEIPILDDNSIFSEAFQVVNLKAGIRRTFNNFSFDLYGGINNLFDEKYAAQVLINPRFNQRYFYPGQAINYFGGLSLSLTL